MLFLLCHGWHWFVCFHLTRYLLIPRLPFFFYVNVNTSGAFVLFLFFCLGIAVVDEDPSLAIAVFSPGDASLDLADEASLNLYLPS